jgi:hypothetical protein
MVPEVGQQENGDRADSTTGLNKRRQRTIEKEGAWRFKEGEHHTWYPRWASRRMATEPTPPLA